MFEFDKCFNYICIIDLVAEVWNIWICGIWDIWYLDCVIKWNPNNYYLFLKILQSCLLLYFISWKTKKNCQPCKNFHQNSTLYSCYSDMCQCPNLFLCNTFHSFCWMTISQKQFEIIDFPRTLMNLSILDRLSHLMWHKNRLYFDWATNFSFSFHSYFHYLFAK